MIDPHERVLLHYALSAWRAKCMARHPSMTAYRQSLDRHAEVLGFANWIGASAWLTLYRRQTVVEN